MNILALHPSSELYGADRFFIKNVSILKESGFNVQAFVKLDGPLMKFAKDNMVSLNEMKDLPVVARSNISPRSIFKLVINLLNYGIWITKRKKHYDVIYINTMALFLCTIVSRLIGYKGVIILHSHEIISHHGPLAKLMILCALKYSSRIICVSNAVAEDMLYVQKEKFSNKCVVVHNGINIIKVDKGLIKKDDDKIRFLLLGRIMPEKGQWFLVDTLKTIEHSILDKTRFEIVGGPPPNRIHLLDELKSYIIDSNLEKYISISEFIKDPYNKILESDVCLIPSIMRDPFPTTVIEAMALYKPVIVTNNGGAKEIVNNEVEGFLIEPGNVDEFKMVLLKICNDRSLIEKMGIRAFKKYQVSLTESHYREKLLKVF